MASAAPLPAVEGGDDLVVSPELALVDPQLAAIARARLPPPPPPVDGPRARAPFVPELVPAAEPRITVFGRWLVSALFALSIAGNVVAVRYAWDDDVSPQAVTPVLTTGYSKSPQGVGTATTGTDASSHLTAAAVQVRVLRELALAPALRRRFVGSAGTLYPGVSVRCSRRNDGGAGSTRTCDTRSTAVSC